MTMPIDALRSSGLVLLAALTLGLAHAGADAHPLADLSHYERGDCVVTLADGRQLDGFNITETPHILLGARESLDEAWGRLGLNAPGDAVTTERYVACVQDAAARLEADRFISADSRRRYVDEASRRRLPS